MAEWIKWNRGLAEKPQVIRMARALKLQPWAVAGGLMVLWEWGDANTIDGNAAGITQAFLDSKTCDGFSAAMKKVGWLEEDDSGIRFVNFTEHNTETAKRRAEATIRQKLSRGRRSAVTEMSQDSVTGCERDNIPRPFRRDVMKRDDFRCAYCGKQSDSQREATRKALLSIDHIIPMTRGGKTIMSNLICCCKLCNNEKNNRTPEEWGLLPEFLPESVVYRDGSVTQMSQNAVTNALPEKRREEKREEKQQQQGAANMESETPGATRADGGLAAAFFYLHGDVGYSQSDARKIADESARILEKAGWPQRVDQRARDAWRTAHARDVANVKGFVRAYMEDLTYQLAPEVPRTRDPGLLAEAHPAWQQVKDAERVERVAADEAAQRERVANVELLAQYDRPALADLETRCRPRIPEFLRLTVPADATVETNAHMRAAVVAHLRERAPEGDGQQRMALGS